MCNCKKQPDFKRQLAEAKKQTELTGETYVVFFMKAVNLNFVGLESGLNDELGICCYYLPDGTEKPYVSSSDAAEMNVTDAKNESASVNEEDNSGTEKSGDRKNNRKDKPTPDE